MVSPTALVIGMIVFGSLNTIVRKAQMETCSSSSFPADPAISKGCTDPSQEPFNKPWMGNLFMFIGELLLFVSVWSEPKRQRQSQSQSDLMTNLPDLPSIYLALPASLDVLGSGLSGVSMLFISASVWQMLRGSMIIYTAILSVIFLKRKLSSQHFIGLLTAFAGLSLVGYSAYLDSAPADAFRSLFAGTFLFNHLRGIGEESDSSSLVMLGIILTVLSQLCSAVQVVVEEAMLKNTDRFRTPSPSRVVAFEGLWGFIIMSVVLFAMQIVPGDDHGSYENSVDAYEKMSNNSFLFFLIVVYCLSIALFNQCGMAVSKYLSSLHRTLIDSLRAVVVWGAQLAMFYFFDSQSYGVAWTRNSWLQLVGFILLFLGTLIYNEVIVLCCPRGRVQSEGFLPVD
jgi:drug/metabolite transporter (DMT)-like permease